MATRQRKGYAILWGARITWEVDWRSWVIGISIWKGFFSWGAKVHLGPLAVAVDRTPHNMRKRMAMRRRGRCGC